MSKQKKLLLFLIFFAAVTGFIDFFHTETDFDIDYHCPACIFRSTYFAAAGALILAIAFLLHLIIVLQNREISCLCFGRPADVKNKSPPA